MTWVRSLVSSVVPLSLSIACSVHDGAPLFEMPIEENDTEMSFTLTDDDDAHSKITWTV